MRHVTTAPLEDRGYAVTVRNVRIVSVRGVPSSYGPGGYGLGFAPDGSRGWLTGLASVIDNRGGTGAEFSALRNRGELIDTASDGDTFDVRGVGCYRLHVGQLGRLTLERIETDG